MVGLRWWSIINTELETEFYFESKQYQLIVPRVDFYVFWYGLYGVTCFWTLMMVIKLVG